jgi:glycosyltransferase involved in cell wall biosynthesis
MPVHNGARYLAEAVDSILGQTFADFEFLILDDGSTDSTPALLARRAAGDSRIRVVSRPNRGLTASLNELLAQARGEFIARMDADDVALPERFARQVEFLEGNPGVVCVGGATLMIDGEGRFLTVISPPADDAAIQSAALAGHGAITHPSAMMRRTALEAVRGYDDNYPAAEDLDLWLRLGEVGKLANLPTPVLKYRLHANSISEGKRELQRNSARRACEAAWMRRGISGRFEAGEAWRPGTDAVSRHRFMLLYGWWAWNSGQRSTALYYGWRALRERALHPDGWKLLLAAMAKPVPKPGGTL